MVPAKEKLLTGETKALVLFYNFEAFATVTFFFKTETVRFDWNFPSYWK